MKVSEQGFHSRTLHWWIARFREAITKHQWSEQSVEKRPTMKHLKGAHNVWKFSWPGKDMLYIWERRDWWKEFRTPKMIVLKAMITLVSCKPVKRWNPRRFGWKRCKKTVQNRWQPHAYCAEDLLWLGRSCNQTCCHVVKPCESDFVSPKGLFRNLNCPAERSVMVKPGEAIKMSANIDLTWG